MAQQTFNLPYREEPYQITATRQFYHSQTKTVSINPTTPNPNLSFELVRKTGEWIYTEDSEVIPYGRTVVEDINVEEEDSYISEPGVDGLREFSEEREWIDGIWTGETRSRTETIVDPINEIYILGTAVVTQVIDVFRTEVIPYTTEEYNSNDYFIGEVVVTQQGANGVRTFYRYQKYINGVATGEFTGEEYPAVTTQPITHRIAIGTKATESSLTITTNSIIHPTSSYFHFNNNPQLVGRSITKIEINGMVAHGNWTLEDNDQMYLLFGSDAQTLFGQSFPSIPIGTTMIITYSQKEAWLEVTTKSTISNTDTYFHFDHNPKLEDKIIKRMRIAGMTVHGSWTATGSPQMFLLFGSDAQTLFGKSFTTISPGAIMHFIYNL